VADEKKTNPQGDQPNMGR